MASETASENREWRARQVSARHLGLRPRRDEAYREYRRAVALLEAERGRVTPSFRVMLAVALALHLLVMASWAILTHLMPEEMPVTIVQLRLGVSEAPPAPVPGIDQAASGDAANAGKPVPVSAKSAAPVITTHAASQKGSRSTESDPIEETGQNAETGQYRGSNQASATAVAAGFRARAHATGTSSGVSHSGGADSNGTVVGNAESGQAVASRYTQEISAWLERFKSDPGAGVRGRLLVRVRIDRQGRVLMKWVEHPSGMPALDAAVLAQVARADPLPAPPAAYPGGGQLEFEFPVTVGE